MRRIRGFVCSSKVKNSPMATFLFGQAVSPMIVELGSGYESLETNGLVPFKNLNQAKTARMRLQRRKSLNSLHVEKLSMMIAEDQVECEDRRFQRSNSLVIVAGFKFGPGLLGPAVGGVCRTCNELCSPFFSSGLTVFESYGLANWPLLETARLVGRATLATFKLERVE